MNTIFGMVWRSSLDRRSCYLCFATRPAREAAVPKALITIPGTTRINKKHPDAERLQPAAAGRNENIDERPTRSIKPRDCAAGVIAVREDVKTPVWSKYEV